ncbi:MAG: hypothetical protein ACLSWY_10385 [Ruthenibacterium lactatiformans]
MYKQQGKRNDAGRRRPFRAAAAEQLALGRTRACLS